MTWSKAFKWAMPFWVALIGGIGASMFFTDFATDVGTTEALKRLCLVALVGLPLVAFLIKATVDDIARLRAAFPKNGRDRDEG